MSENIQTAMLEIMKKIQAQLADHDRRFDRIEEIMRKLRRDSAGMLVMMRATAGDFDQRVGEIEARMDAFDAKRS
jgi:hypothetical protein